jgi:hypothetical protein
LEIGEWIGVRSQAGGSDDGGKWVARQDIEGA